MLIKKMLIKKFQVYIVDMLNDTIDLQTLFIPLSFQVRQGQRTTNYVVFQLTTFVDLKKLNEIRGRT